MAFFEWSSKYEIGISTIDFQHQSLVNIVNNLFDVQEEKDPGVQKAVIEYTMDRLIEYTVFHFETEEELMTKVSYDHLQEHKKAHEALKAKAVEIQAKLIQGEKVLPQLLDFLMTWLQEHILKVDMQYVPAFKKAGLAEL